MANGPCATFISRWPSGGVGDRCLRRQRRLPGRPCGL